MKFVESLFVLSLLLGSYSVWGEINAKPFVAIEFTNQQFQFAEQPFEQFQSGSLPGGPIIIVDDITQYQTISGFGASLTESSAYVLSNLPKDTYFETLHKLFNTTSGIGVNYLRLPMSASDFALSDYSYDDMPPGQTDDNLNHFNIERDRKYVIPILKDILKINPQVKIMFSPWSPPGWMKTTGSMKGNSGGVDSRLKTEHYQAYANLFVKAIQAFRGEGINVDTLTIQNEPLYAPIGYPGMIMDQYEQTDFINNFLAPAFIKANIKTKVFVYDHNWDRIDYPAYVFENLNEKASEIVGGAALHCYGGAVTNQTNLHNQFPHMPIYLTECSGGDWFPGWDENLLSDMQTQLIGGVNNWAEVVIKWNLVLDQNNGPTNGGCLTCWGLVTVDTNTHQVTETVNFYTLGAFSKHIAQGAVRMRVASTDDKFLVTGFINPDNSRVVYVLNQDTATQNFSLSWNQNWIKVSIPGHTVGVYFWKP